MDDPSPRADHGADHGGDLGRARENDVRWMGEALTAARTAAAHGEVPVGAVVVVDGQVVAVAGNDRQASGDPTGHAELIALREAARRLGGWRLTGATVVVTLEPCLMCAGAMLQARVGRVVYGAADPKAGAMGSLYNVAVDPRLNHEIEVTWDVRAEECGALLSDFFAAARDPGVDSPDADR